MNDARMSVDQIAYERRREQEAHATQAQTLMQRGQTLGRPRGVLTSEAAAARQTLQVEAKARETVGAVPVSRPAAVVEPVRFERFAVVAIFILIMGLIWIRFKTTKRS